MQHFGKLGLNMSLQNKKIISIIQEECKDTIEERCLGYRKELCETIVTILESERLHKVSSMNIQKRVNDKCTTMANFLARKLEESTIIKDSAS